MLPRNLSESTSRDATIADDLANGIPAIAALANLCGKLLAREEDPSVSLDDIPRHAQAILFSARSQGALSLRGDKNAFEPAERYLAVCVDLAEGERLEFRDVAHPETTLQFLDGFRKLCQTGLVMHHLLNEFSLTAAGFRIARDITESSVEELIAVARRI